MRLKSPTDALIFIALLSGHTLTIGPEGTNVPEIYLKEAFINGAIPDDMTPEEFSLAPVTPGDVDKLVLLINGVKKMLVENPDDFTGAGLPDRRVLSGLVGWNVNVQELSEAWAAIQSEAVAPE